MHCIQNIQHRLKQFATAASGPILSRRSAAVALLAFLAPGLLVAQPTQVWVNSGYGPGNANYGHQWGTEAFSSIQDGVNAVAAGGTVDVATGTFVE